MKRLARARGDLKAAQELKHIDDIEAKQRTLQELKKTRALTEIEQKEVEKLGREHAKAQEMLAIPPEAVQVDVWTHDAESGELKKSHFYTAAEAPDHIAEIRKEGASGAGGSTHPMVEQMAQRALAAPRQAGPAVPSPGGAVQSPPPLPSFGVVSASSPGLGLGEESKGSVPPPAAFVNPIPHMAPFALAELRRQVSSEPAKPEDKKE
jgi:hypothetical protein